MKFLRRRYFLNLPLVLVLLFSMLGSAPLQMSRPAPKKAPTLSAAQQVQTSSNYGKLPLAFEINEGQTDGQVRFLSRGRGYGLFITPAEAVLQLNASVGKPIHPGSRSSTTTQSDQVHMRIIGGNRLCRVEGEDKLPGISNYFIGNDPTQWRTYVAQYAKVRLKDVYPGVDMVYYGNQGHLEYDFVVKPGADPHVIRLAYEGVERSTLAGGNLDLKTHHGLLVFKAPVVYQEKNGEKTALDGRYVKAGGNQMAFAVEGYDKTGTLVIDPQLDYSTYLGGDSGVSKIVADSGGNAYVIGQAGPTNYPTTAGAYQTTGAGSQNVIVTKLNPTGTALIYSTYIGGNNRDGGEGIAIDATGDAYLTGNTTSTNFPTTPGAFQTTLAGTYNAFAAELNPSGSALIYSTYLGGNFENSGAGVAIDPNGNAYICGWTQATNFPTTPGSYQPAGAGSYDAFITKLNPGGTGLVYSTCLGGILSDAAYGIALDSNGDAYVTGITRSTDYPTTPGTFQTTNNDLGGTAFVTEMNPTGTALVFSTYLGGTGSSNKTWGDGGWDIALDGPGAIYISGFTNSADFPTTSGAFQTILIPGYTESFVTKFDPGGATLAYSTYLGPNANSGQTGIAVDAGGNAYVTGTTAGPFPTTPGALQPTLVGLWDAFVTELNPTGTALVYSSYLGGTGENYGNDIALDTNLNIYVTGWTTATDFPTVAGDYQVNMMGNVDAFVTKFSIVVSTPTPTATATITPTFTPTATLTPTCVTHLWPDPFNPNFAVGKTLKVDCLPAGGMLSFYTISGELVDQVVVTGPQYQWDGTNRQGRPVAAGVYFYVVQNGSAVSARGKFLVAR